MCEIVLAVVIRNKVLSVNEIVKETELKKADVMKALEFLNFKGNLSFLSPAKEFNYLCSSCSLRQYRKIRGGKNGVFTFRKP
jgi:hypothetical protein